MSQKLARLGIVISGRGSNMEAIAAAIERAELDAEIGLVVSNVATAPGLALARARGLDAVVLDHRGHDRADHDARMTEALAIAGCELVCLAGYMRLLSPEFVARHEGRLLNIHPSLLPAFPGLHPQRQALKAGVRVSGATVHFVDAHCDHGPIVAQEAVPVLPDDDEERLSARILEVEHRLYPRAIGLVVSGRARLAGDRVDFAR